jgi:hypothetical protein
MAKFLINTSETEEFIYTVEANSAEEAQHYVSEFITGTKLNEAFALNNDNIHELELNKLVAWEILSTEEV